MNQAALLLSSSVALHTFTITSLFGIVDKVTSVCRNAFFAEILCIRNFNIYYKPRQAWAVRCNPLLWGGLEGLPL